MSRAVQEGCIASCVWCSLLPDRTQKSYLLRSTAVSVVVVRLPRPMEVNGVTLIFRSLQNYQFHHRWLESLKHFNVLHIYIYIILSTTVSHFWTLRIRFFLQCPFFWYTFLFLQVHFACVMYLTSI